MFEFSPFAEEAPLPANDILTTYEWGELCEKALEAENDLVLFEDEDQSSYEMGRRVATWAVALGDIFDREYTNQPCRALGFAYPSYCLEGVRDEDEERPIETKSIDSSKMIFFGAGLFRIAGRWRAMLELYSPEFTDEVPNQSYYVPLCENSLMYLYLQESHEDADDTTVTQAIAEKVQASRDFIQSSTFSQLSAMQQRVWLEQSIIDMENEVETLQDTEVAVVCKQYSVTYDSAPGVMVGVNSDIRPPSLEASEPVAVKGVIKRFEYSELATLPIEGHLNVKDFYLNEGICFMLVRSEEEAATYYVPAQMIVDII